MNNEYHNAYSILLWNPVAVVTGERRDINKLVWILLKRVLRNCLLEWEMQGIGTGLFPVGDFRVSDVESLISTI
jgi:hypothetical protein